MSKPFDATLNDLAVVNPAQLLAELDRPPTLPVRLLNVDLSTVTTATDIGFGLGDPLQEVVHVDAQTAADADKHRDMLVYNALYHRQYKVPVHSVLLLLRRPAQHGEQTGAVVYAARPGRGKMDFGYEIVRLWERPAEALLGSGLAVAPLAVLGTLPESLSLVEGMRGVVNQVVERLKREAPPGMYERLVNATGVLTGLRVNLQQAQAILQGVPAVRDSVYYQAVLEEGMEKGAILELQRTLLRLGRVPCGEPDERVRQTVLAITDLARLERMSERLFSVKTWQDLLQTP
jgi:hypothetical protein